MTEEPRYGERATQKDTNDSPASPRSKSGPGTAAVVVGSIIVLTAVALVSMFFVGLMLKFLF